MYILMAVLDGILWRGWIYLGKATPFVT